MISDKICLFLLLALANVIKETTSDCIHHKVQSKHIERQYVQYFDSLNEKHHVVKRDGRGRPHSPPRRPHRPPMMYPGMDGFYPIRINVHYSEIDKELSSSEQEKLQRIMMHAVEKVREIFSVKPIQGNLLLKRSAAACAGILQAGPNVGKCSKISNGYSGETCLDGFRIPEEHLERLEEWEYSGSQPSHVYAEDGLGMSATDYMLYIKSATTKMCLQGDTNVIAYAGYCHLDQHSRPISGVINICPELLKRSDCDEDKVEITALHEIFHALGFSEDLFGKFRNCSDGMCMTYHRPVRFVRGVQRLVTPRAVAQTSAHFGCYQQEGTMNEFGPILDKQPNGDINPHWDAAFMQGSIMTPSIGEPHLTIIDVITLATFEDSGWYRINYHYAQHYEWGRGAGCSFAVEGSCDSDRDSKYFCEGSGIGCHFMHYDKGQCDTDPFLYGCRVYKAKPEYTCKFNSGVVPKCGEIYRQNSRCFMSNVSSDMPDVGERLPLEGRCFEHRCLPGAMQQVKLINSMWKYCPSLQMVQIPGVYGVVQCPDIKVMCDPFKPPPKGEHLLPTEPQPEPDKLPQDVVCIELLFRYNYGELQMKNLLKVFKEEVSREIMKRTKCTLNRIRDVDVYAANGMTVFRFNLMPVEDMMADGPMSDKVYKILMEEIEANNFYITIPDRKIVASELRIIPMNPTESSTDFSDGAIAGIVVALVLVAVIIGVLVFYVQRYYALQSRIHNSYANYPSAFQASSPPERRASNPSIASGNESNQGSMEQSYSDLVSYHSDMESYPVSSGQYSTNRGSLSSDILGGHDNLAYTMDSKCSVRSSSSSDDPSVVYVSTVNVGDKEESKGSVKDRIDTLNNKESARKISSDSDNSCLKAQLHSSDDLYVSSSDKCNGKLPHNDDEFVVTTIGIRDRTSSEITISTTRAKYIRAKLEEKKRVKSQENVHSPGKMQNHLPSFYKGFANGNMTRDSMVTISTVSSRDQSMSDVTISTLSQNSVFMGSSGQLANAPKEYSKKAFQNGLDTTQNPHRFSSLTQSTILSSDVNSSNTDDETGEKKHPISPGEVTTTQPSHKSWLNGKVQNLFKRQGKGNKAFEKCANKAECAEVRDEFSRTGSLQSHFSECSCSHTHNHLQGHHKNKSAPTSIPHSGAAKVRSASASSDSSYTSNECSECDSCPYCKECSSIISQDPSDKTKYVSVVSTEDSTKNSTKPV